jgi:hypothetical protein
MADNRTTAAPDPNRPDDAKNGPGKQENIGSQGTETFAGDQDDRESRQTAEQQGEVPRPGTQQGNRRPDERDPSHRVERSNNT